MAKKEGVAGILEKIGGYFEVAKEEASRFEEKEVNSAGKDVRKALKEISSLAKAGRNLVTEIKNTRKNKKGKSTKKEKEEKKSDKKKKKK